MAEFYPLHVEQLQDAVISWYRRQVACLEADFYIWYLPSRDDEKGNHILGMVKIDTEGGPGFVLGWAERINKGWDINMVRRHIYEVASQLPIC